MSTYQIKKFLLFCSFKKLHSNNYFSGDNINNFNTFLQVETQICVDPVFRPHYQHYVREARIKAYVQLLRAYRSLSLDNIADTFGVSREFVEEEISK